MAVASEMRKRSFLGCNSAAASGLTKAVAKTRDHMFVDAIDWRIAGQFNPPVQPVFVLPERRLSCTATVQDMRHKPAVVELDKRIVSSQPVSSHLPCRALRSFGF